MTAGASEERTVQVCTEHSALPSFGRMLLGRLVQAVQANGRRALCVLRAAPLPVRYGADPISFRHWLVAQCSAVKTHTGPLAITLAAKRTPKAEPDILAQPE